MKNIFKSVLAFSLLAFAGVAVAASSYYIFINTAPTVVGRDVSINDATVTATNYVGQFSSYSIAVDWGDGTPPTTLNPLSNYGVTITGNNFSGNWATTGSPIIHTYAYPGAYLVSSRLYKGNSGSASLAVTYDNVTVVCTPDFPPFYPPC